MTARRRTGTGRTTPKGTSKGGRSTGSKASRKPSQRLDRQAPLRKQFDQKKQPVSRPDSHNRGNR